MPDWFIIHMSVGDIITLALLAVFLLAFVSVIFWNKISSHGKKR